MSIDELEKEALRLNPEGRAHLARELLAGLDALSEVEVEKLRIGEAGLRDEELDTGVSRAHPAGEVLARARARRKWGDDYRSTRPPRPRSTRLPISKVPKPWARQRIPR